MKDFWGKLLTALLWAWVVVTVPLLAVRWVDSSAGVVAALQSMVPMTGVLVVVLVAVAARPPDDG